MKKSYIYFVIPIAALVIFFFAFYWNAHKNYADREAAMSKLSGMRKRPSF